jgi:hypothetical protein
MQADNVVGTSGRVESLGAPQVQAVASEDQRSARLVWAGSPRKSNVLCPLAALSWQRPKHQEPCESRGSRAVVCPA